ncbi:hypothetical protein HRW18_24930 [Streptomyces lunaelactis]|uniref:hypothetical protein n=1 Tax=Streptomyces lunaelactis TaxID=1535768 RepID=UPI0015856519|nr:hypothetical protein [Streptomyces lunaelactis]NUK11163.1 hypothetical protein [Streptomyces lunaelactis]NUK74674.1 hypothetical protein [Streptomyces lunaelactis]NUL13225.1 hypothetical protein [Streptomyces lunaelactis]NUL26239.1 hypothetical protein [Streptomyces lunaelactis]
MALGARRERGNVIGFGAAAVCFALGTAFLGFTAGARFMDNVVFSKMYGLFVTGMALVPLLAWRGPAARRRRPGYVQVMWLPWLYITAHGVLYSHDRSSAHIIVLFLGWGAFIFAGTVGMYFLGWEMWGKPEDEKSPADGEGSPASA